MYKDKRFSCTATMDETALPRTLGENETLLALAQRQGDRRQAKLMAYVVRRFRRSACRRAGGKRSGVAVRDGLNGDHGIDAGRRRKRRAVHHEQIAHLPRFSVRIGR